MLVRCPQCKTEFRLTGDAPTEKVVRYLCPGCETIVKIDIALDEVLSSSSSDSRRKVPRRRTILVVDDNDTILAQCEGLLSGAGHQVLLANGGAEALRLIREAHPDVVVLDLHMPDTTGFDVIREMRLDERVKDTAILAISSVYKDTILELLQQLGAKGFLDKAQLKESLVFRVESLLHTPSGAV